MLQPDVLVLVQKEQAPLVWQSQVQTPGLLVSLLPAWLLLPF